MGPVLGVLALAVVGTLAPWVLFAFGQARVPAAFAGAFLNIEPLVGAVLGASFFADPLGPLQVGAGLAIVAGVALSTMAATAPAERAPQTDPTPDPEPRRTLRSVPAGDWSLEDVSADSLVLDRWAVAA